mgnify:CR=1 FL=1
MVFWFYFWLMVGIYNEVDFYKMSWLNYVFGCWEKVVEFKVDYSLVTKSGNNILEIRKIIKLDKPLIRNYGDFAWRLWEEDILKKYREIINKEAEEILNEYQKKQRKRLNSCVLDGGDYIVKCSWDINMSREDITYEEYKKERKEHGR